MIKSSINFEKKSVHFWFRGTTDLLFKVSWDLWPGDNKWWRQETAAEAWENVPVSVNCLRMLIYSDKLETEAFATTSLIEVIWENINKDSTNLPWSKSDAAGTDISSRNFGK